MATKREKEVLKAILKDEEDVLEELKENYQKALDDINSKINEFQAMALTGELTQSKIYQLNFQLELKRKIEEAYGLLDANNYATIESYLMDCYNNGQISLLYELQGKGVPLTLPLDVPQAVKVVSTPNSAFKLSERLYSNTTQLKDSIRSELTRGLASGMSSTQIAQNIANANAVDMAKATRIVRTEGNRINNQARLDTAQKAKERGCKMYKRWDAVLDGKTRPDHQALDGTMVEVDEVFTAPSGDTALEPCGFGIAEQDCNCRCQLSFIPKWYADSDDYTIMKIDGEHNYPNANDERVTIDGSNYQEFKSNYWNWNSGK